MSSLETWLKSLGMSTWGFAVSFEVATGAQTQYTHRDKIGRVREPIQRTI